MISCTAEFINDQGTIHKIYFRNRTFNVSNIKFLTLTHEFEYMKEIQVEIVKNSPLKGSKYIETPRSIIKKRLFLTLK